MPLEFDATEAPFDRLTIAERERTRAALDVAYFRPLQTIIARDGETEGLFVVIKGCVEERDGGETIALRGPGDWFDSRALVQGRGANAFVAREETLCHLLPRAAALRLIADNPRFGAFFYADVSRKLGAVAADDDAASARPLMQTRVRELRLAQAPVVSGQDTIAGVGARLDAAGANAALVSEGERTGVVTGTDLWRATVLKRLPLTTPVSAIATFALVAVEADDFVARALMKMTKHNVRRVAVSDAGATIGFLEDIDLLAFLGAGSQAIAARIDRAASIDDLKPAAERIAAQPRLLRRQGVKIEVVCEIVSDLNRSLFAKTFAALAPPSILARGCLFVMGSEGRGEQTVRTDQDNGLLLTEAVPPEDLDSFRARFSAALASFGFPPCPGGVMVSNPKWSKTADEFRADIARWIAIRDEAAALDASILFDAAAVAGDWAPLESLKRDLIGAASGERAFLAQFAKAVDAFPTPIGMFNTLVTPKGAGDALDLKKGGIFPIVHGVRALALDKGIGEAGTAARIAKLAEEGAFAREFAADLIEAFHFLMALRLDAQLAEMGASSLVRPGALTTMERDLLRDALQVAKRLREIVRRHFNLAAF